MNTQLQEILTKALHSAQFAAEDLDRARKLAREEFPSWATSHRKLADLAIQQENLSKEIAQIADGYFYS